MAPKLVGTWELERYILGELPPNRLKEVHLLIDQHTELREEIERLKQSNEAILEQYPPDIIVPQILNRADDDSGLPMFALAAAEDGPSPENLLAAAERPGRFRGARPNSRARKRLLYITPVLASVLLLVFILFRPDRTSELITRIKGGDGLDMSQTQILIYRKNIHDVERLTNGDSVRSGDLLQIAYIAAHQKYGVIFSIDGSGLVTLHFPGDEASSTQLEPDRQVTIRSSYELDDAPGFERFFFITSEREINTRDILERARAQAKSLPSAQKERLDLPSGLSQFAILLKKG